MKTLLFTLEYPPFYGGVANYYGNLVKYWPAYAKASAGKPEADEILVLNNNRGELLSGLPLSWLKAIGKLRRVVREKMIGHVLVGQILPLGAAALICSWFCQIKYSVILHGLDFTLAVKSGRKRFISQKILSRAEKIICGNSYVAELIKRTWPRLARKLIVVNPGVEDLTTHNPQLATQLKEKHSLSDKVILLSVGRLIKRKGFDKVIEALPETLKKLPNLVYVIIGEGEELNNLERRIANYGLKDKVIIINKATDQERDHWYQACDIFIMPARNLSGDFEGFGIVYLEANLAGKPVIAGRSGGVSDAVVDELNGFMVTPDNISDISEKIIRLALDPELRQRLGRQGRERAIKNFNWKKQALKIHKLIM